MFVRTLAHLPASQAKALLQAAGDEECVAFFEARLALAQRAVDDFASRNTHASGDVRATL